MANRFAGTRYGLNWALRRLGEGLPFASLPAMATLILATIFLPGTTEASERGIFLLALVAAGLFVLLRSFGLLRPWASLSAVALCMGTALWPATTGSLRSLVETLALLGMLLATLAHLRSRKAFPLVLALGLGSLAALSGGSWALGLPFWGRWILAEGALRDRPLLRRLTVPLLVLLSFLLLVGHFAGTGGFALPSRRFGTWSLEGALLSAWAAVASFDRSFFLYSPPLLLVFWGASRLAEEARPLFGYLGWQCLIAWLWVSVVPVDLPMEGGGLPRLLPLLILLAPAVVRGGQRLVQRRDGRFLLVLLMVLAGLVQFSLVAWSPPRLRRVALRELGLSGGEGAAFPFDPRLSALRLGLRRLARFDGGRAGEESRLWLLRFWGEAETLRGRVMVVGGGLGGLLLVLVLLAAPFRWEKTLPEEKGLRPSRPGDGPRRRFGPWRLAARRRTERRRQSPNLLRP